MYYIYIYIYIYSYLRLAARRLAKVAPSKRSLPGSFLLDPGDRMCLFIYQEGTGSVRFVSVPDFPTVNRFGSVRFGKTRFQVRRGSACVFRTRRSSVRLGSLRFRVRFWPVLELNGSVRPVRFGFLLLPDISKGLANRRRSRFFKAQILLPVDPG